MKFVLDTSAYIGIINGDHQIKIYLAGADSIMVPAIVIGELFYGYHKGNRFYDNNIVLQRFLDTERVSVAPVDTKIAERYGKLKNGQFSTGQVLADNDLWIAATCLHLELPLLTFDNDFFLIKDNDFQLLPV